MHVVRAHPGILSHLSADPRVVIGGAEQAVHAGLNLLAIAAVPEAYTREDDWPALVREFGLFPGSAEPNLVVRIPRALWPFDGVEAGPATPAADLVEADEPRAQAAGAAWLNARSRHVGGG